jgi:hypothetical protein
MFSWELIRNSKGRGRKRQLLGRAKENEKPRRIAAQTGILTRTAEYKPGKLLLQPSYSHTPLPIS